jgi:hypothetical protein
LGLDVGACAEGAAGAGEYHRSGGGIAVYGVEEPMQFCQSL